MVLQAQGTAAVEIIGQERGQQGLRQASTAGPERRLKHAQARLQRNGRGQTTPLARALHTNLKSSAVFFPTLPYLLSKSCAAFSPCHLIQNAFPDDFSQRRVLSSVLQSSLIKSVLSHLLLSALHGGYFYTFLSLLRATSCQGCEFTHLCVPHIRNKCSINVLSGWNSIFASGSDQVQQCVPVFLHYQNLQVTLTVVLCCGFDNIR